MASPRLPWILLLALSLLLAGCATPTAVEGGDGAGPEVGDGSGEDGAADEWPEHSDGDDGASGAAERWSAYAFTQRVEPRSGDAGRLESFRYELTQESDGEALVLDVLVELAGTSTTDVRTVRMSATDFTESTVSAAVELTELKHTVTVVRDDSGEREAGETATVVAFVPTDEAAAERTFLLGFAKMGWTDEQGRSGSWEYFLTPEMAAEQDEGDAFFAPFQEGEGDVTGWWGYEIFVMTYDPVWLAGWSDGDQGFEEGTWSFGGYTYLSERKVLEVGGYAFDGWHVEWRASADGSTGVYSFEVAPALPIPYAYTVGGSDTSGSGEESSSHWAYRLTDLRLG